MARGPGGGPVNPLHQPVPPPPAEVLARVAREALREDGAEGDVTSRAFVPPRRTVAALVRVKEDGVVCGHPAALAVVRALSTRVTFTRLVAEGTRVEAGAPVAALRGPARAILAAERTLLNLLGRLSGVATLTRRFVDAVEGTGVTVHPTRKTTPGLRALELYAVGVGGGTPHRRGLDDAVLAKENHYRAAGLPFAEALRRAQERVPPGVAFGTEVESLGELCLALEAEVDLVLLDDFPVELVRRAVAERAVRGRGRVPLLEATGGITLENVRAYAGTGVERVSVGALTRGAPWLDMAMKIEEGPGE